MSVRLPRLRAPSSEGTRRADPLSPSRRLVCALLGDGGAAGARRIAVAAAPDDEAFAPLRGFEPDRREGPRRAQGVRRHPRRPRRPARRASPAARLRGRRDPRPDGTLQAFRVEQTQRMESELAAAHPEIATWSGAASTTRAPPSPSTSRRWASTPSCARPAAAATGTSTPPTTAPARPRTSATARPTCRPRSSAAQEGEVDDDPRHRRRGRRRPGPRTPGTPVAAPLLPPRADLRPVLRRLLRHRQRARREGDPDQPGQPDLQRRPRDRAAPGQRHRQAQPRHRRQGDRRQRPVRRGAVLRALRRPRRRRTTPDDDLRATRLLRRADPRQEPHRPRPAGRRLQLRHRPHRARHQRRWHRLPRRRRRRLQGRRLHRPARAQG